jgi:hypothetical protein
MTVVILEDAADDVETGREFYESQQVGVGDYFVETILSDLSFLIICAGAHPSASWFSSYAFQGVSVWYLLRT